MYLCINKTFTDKMFTALMSIIFKKMLLLLVLVLLQITDEYKYH